MDISILRYLNLWTVSPIIAAIAIFLSSPYMLIATCGPLAVVLIRKKAFAAMLTIALAMATTDAINARIIKPMIARERPCRALQDLIAPVKCNVGQSFASGHAAVAFAFAITASPTVRFGWFIFPLLAFLVALSRVLLGVHYPTDITAGAMLGAAIGGSMLGLKKLITAPSQPRHDPPATTAPSDPPP
jgi:membrane-associated phospholipid phosphatase